MEVVRGRGEGGIGYGVRRGLSERSAGITYQVIVSSILRPHTTDTDATMLSSTSTIVQVEEARVDIPRWLHKGWVGVRQEGRFNTLEGWAVKEISGEIEVPVEDLMNTTSPAATHKALPATHIPTTTTTPRGSAFRGTNEYEHGDPGAEET